MQKKYNHVVIMLVLIMMSTQLAWAEDANIDNGLGKLKAMTQFIQENYYVEVSDKEILDAVYSGMFDALDKHSVYFTQEEYEAFNQSVGGYFYGVGISIEPSGDYIKVVSPIEGSPASKKDIKSGDLIKTVDGLDIKGMSIEEVVLLVRGPEGTPVTLGLIREGVDGLVVVTVNRGRVEVNPVVYEVKENNIGYMRISQFSQNLVEHYDEALNQLIDQSKVSGLIIDLRYNPGGSLDAVLETLDRLLPEGKPVLHVDYRAYEDDSYLTKTVGSNIPVVVLINEWSASASEIFAGSLQDNGRALIVGTTSYGKGTVQHTIPLLDGSGIKMTVAQYLTGGKKVINEIGVTPDYVVENVSLEMERIKKEFAPMLSAQDSIKGDKDLDVLGAQQRLNYIGFNVRKDGYFDNDTVLALAKLQLDNGLLNSGILNWDTKQLLIAEAKAKAGEQVEDFQLQKAMDLLTQ